MKKLLAIILCLAMLLLLVTGCAGKTDAAQDGSSQEGTSEPSDTSEPSEPSEPGEEASEPASGGTAILQVYGDVMSFCPDINSDDNFYSAAQNIFNRLAKLDANCNVIPDLAESWDYSEDGLTLTFHLKENAQWHDGEPVTAEDVKYTFDYIKEHDTCVFNSNMAIVDSIEASDDYTVVFHMNSADMSFVSSLSWYGTFILPEHIYNNGQDWSENDATQNHPIGSGPFKFVEYRQGEGMTLEANPDYHDGAPKLDRLVYSIVPDDTTAMQALINGELDWTVATPSNMVSELENNENIRLVLDSLPSPARIVFNLQNELVADVAVRQAIARCIDRTDISQKTTNGIWPVEYSAYPSSSWAANTTDIYPECDLEAAEQLLIDAGYTKDADGYYLRGLSITAFDVAPYPDAAKLVAANCEKIGIEVTVEVYEYNAWSQAIEVEHDFCMEIQGGFMGPDPNALQPRLVEGGWGNVGFYSNDTVTELLAQGSAETDQAKRAEIYGEIQKTIVEELPYVMIMEYAVYEGANASLRDIPMDGAGQWGWNEWGFAYFAD